MSEARSVWDAGSLWERETWRIIVPDRAVEEFLTAFRETPIEDCDPETSRLDRDPLPTLREFADGLRHNLLRGDGLSWIRGLGEQGLAPLEQRCLYATIGCMLGEPMLQYGRLYEVADRGGDFRSEVIPVSQTGEETGFHTDSSARDAVPDLVGLLCEQPSTEGGQSMVSNAARIHEILAARAPDVLELLREDYVRDIVTPGMPRSRANLLRNRFPVFQADTRRPGILFRYMRYWIEQGQAEVGRPLDDRVLGAFDTLDELLAAPDLAVRFPLAAGDIVFVNNRFVAHNRSAYRDAPDNRRCLQRMWVQAA